MPFKDEARVKAYLLHCPQRQRILAEHGTSVSAAKGALGALSLLRERSFLCLHYQLDQQLQLTPCTASDMYAVTLTLAASWWCVRPWQFY